MERMTYIHNLGLKFREIARLHSNRSAILRPDCVSTSYADLDQLSNRLARLLQQHELGRGDVVAIFHDKSPSAFASMLACLKLGIIYTNLDPDSPWERLRKILQICEAKAIINGFAELPHSQSVTRHATSRIINLRDLHTQSTFQTFDPSDLPEVRNVTGADPAYIMFTSGSTGMPKGAVMSHANLLNFVAWAKERFEITPDDVLSNANPIYFDNSVFDFYAAVFSGAAMAPITSQEAREPRALVRIVNSARCTIWFSVPSLLVYLLTTRVLTAADFPAVRKIIFGGEGFPKPKLKQLYDLFAHRADLENVYGPTECACICSAHTIRASDFADMKGLATLGFLAPNFDYEILALDLQSADFGELFLRGPNVGLGYYNDAERTAKAFIQNPTHRRFADVGYRTGDLVQRDPDGRLHFKGRADFQIKHMGYRIELEEIEAALGTISGVKECAVVYRRFGEGLGQIIGFAALGTPIASEELVGSVARIVPPYMVPKRITILEALPKNANGKIDRLALQSIASSSA